MARIAYEDWRPSPASMALVEQANVICADMRRQGYDLTLRQLYYQFVAKALIPNTERSYKNLGNVISRARMAGLLDWDYLEDRTRSLRGFNHAGSVGEFMSDLVWRYHVNRWLDQENRVEVWVEKEALVSVVGRAAMRFDVDFFACKGYVSQSELWAASQRHLRYERQGQSVTVIHLGDHDPSGIDMTRDVQDRLYGFGTSTEVVRVALNMEQIDRYGPPPNPAKMTDSRSGGYVDLYGDESWELDALTPQVIDDLVSRHIEELIDDPAAFDERAAQQERDRALITEAGNRWDEVVDLLEGA